MPPRPLQQAAAAERRLNRGRRGVPRCPFAAERRKPGSRIDIVGRTEVD